MKSMRQGFSLMELMIYIAIVGLLLAVAGPAYLSYVKRAATSSTETNLRVLKQGISSFHLDTGHYPDSLRDLIRKPVDDDTLSKKWHGPYLEVKGGEIPEDGWRHEFVYNRNEPGSEHPYDLYSYGSEGEDAPQEEWISAW